ncbi:MAG TPA: 50S ribosomal protein L11 methyltransferase, partial [Pyrinomonadaceae bacterium]|nr:50S ribosomal protein L11 methyltransferase [Pyrinomonadaceae bacterium]
MSATNEKWYALDVDTEPQAREAVEYALMESGASGTETATDLTKVTGYFPDVPDRERVREELFEALRIYEMPSSSVRDMSVREVEQRDWLEEWKKSWQPVEVGRFIIAPPWSNVDERPDRVVIRIEPGMAFGTGTHETTRLCLAAVQKYFEGGSFLDVGTGTGILAIAAAMLAPGAHVEACDTDAEAIEIARENAVANGVGERVGFRVGTLDESTSSADFICANLTADMIVKLAPTLVGLSCGRLVLGGILETQIEDVTDVLARLAITDVEITREGE